MRKYEIIRTLLLPIIELLWIAIIFFLAYKLRTITDGIPFIQLRVPYIPESAFIPFIISGVILWWCSFAYAGLYSKRDEKSFTEEIRLVLKYAIIWFFLYMSFIHLAWGFIFKEEVPRLIIFYVSLFGGIFSIILRKCETTYYTTLIRKWYLPRRKILIIENEDDSESSSIEKTPEKEYILHSIRAFWTIESLIREKKIDAILCTNMNYEKSEVHEIIRLARIYGVPFLYPKILPNTDKFVRKDTFIGDMPVTEILSISISPWERITKRMVDIVCSLFGIFILSPLLVIIAIIIKIEDPSGPVIFKNRRIGQDGKIFSLYKFRYMYWKYSVKDAYGTPEKEDEALKYEETLKKESDTRDGPLYKIKDDPRKMKSGKIFEKLSLDELPQLFNVLIGNMSLVWPRPHQPREVELYDEDDKQVLTIKPWITGMAQTYGREKNTFDEEIRLDRYYIENYSLFLDIAILIRTIGVVFSRAFSKR